MQNNTFKYLAIQEKIDRNITIIFALKIFTVIFVSAIIFATSLNFVFKTELPNKIIICLSIFALILFMFLISAYLIKKNKEYELEMYYTEFESLERKKRVAKIKGEFLPDYMDDYVPAMPDETLSLPVYFYSIILFLSIFIILLMLS